ncbi:F-box protein At5g03100-like [Hordeum vulgare subsp. vulgare]|uniref:FBD domain-containing protein n=1 Tax=Hordeum vulgare subsp. vulgare TaxID=112509 RepID=A0A8I6YDH0_HORVV|nr:F-box protein At5g03100-like [Hordeum vulgare subsp. vulgare]
MEARGPSRKRTKFTALKTQEVLPAPEALEAPGHGPPPSAHNQQPPPGVGDDEESADLISNLPDAILGEIVSRLPTNQGARTQILAFRWRHIWSSAPLSIDCEGLAADNEVLAGIVSRTVSAHPPPCRRFCVPSCLLGDRASTVDGWLRTPALDNLQELEFWFKPYYRPQPLQHPPPPSMFRFSATLCVATIGNCNLTDGTVQGLHFPLLKQLGLELVSISECSLHSLIAGCPVLECLLISHGFGFRCLRINSLTLRSFAVKNYRKCNDQLKELIVENAPCLQSLLHLDFDYGLHISVLSAPKLETLGCLSDGFYISKEEDLSRFVFGSTVIQGLRVDKLTTVVHIVKNLAVNMKVLSLDTIIELMRCFPCLEKIYIESESKKEKNVRGRKHQNLIKCPNIRLKTIVFECYQGIKSDIEFASFFILNATVLELMTLQIGARDYNEQFLAEQRRKLQIEYKASRGARFHFTTDKCARGVWDVHHVRDLDLTDPFVC